MQADFVTALNKHRFVAKKKRRATACVTNRGSFDESVADAQVGRQNKAPDELARAVLHLAMEGERAPVRLHDGSLGRTATRCRLARGELIVA
jgi:hypothetical protein